MSAEVNKPIRVRFPMTESIWNKVVVESTGENAVVDEENSICFVMEYDSQADFDKALTRFEGMIEYTVLSE